MSSFATPINDRYFEDYVVGDVFEFGEVTLSVNDIVQFGRQYDPQEFHTDPVAASMTRFGGLIASGWQTGAAVMRLFCDHYLSKNASLSSPGMDEVRWLVPVRPGDRLRLRITVVETKRSNSKPDRGLLRSKMEALNQDGQVVMSMVAMNLIGCRSVP